MIFHINIGAGTFILYFLLDFNKKHVLFWRGHSVKQCVK